jgi:DnaJ-class molecular chaperone
MPEKNHYELLEVSRSADEPSIREQYRLLLYKYHPDHNPGNEDWAIGQTISLVEAVRTLCDPAARKLYDFRITFSPRLQGQTAGLALFKSRARKDAEGLFAEAVLAFRKGDLKPAAESFSQALKLDAGFSDSSYNLAYLLALHGQHAMALEVLGRAMKADPKDEGLIKLRAAISKTFFSF